MIKNNDKVFSPVSTLSEKYARKAAPKNNDTASNQQPKIMNSEPLPQKNVPESNDQK